jgi:hypothetical protein
VRSKWPVSVLLGTNFIEAHMILPGLWQFPTLAGSNYTIIRALIAETESGSVTNSAGDSHQSFTNSAFSNLRGTRLNANAPSDFVGYGITNIPAGLYRIHVVADAGSNSARFQLAVGPVGGALTNLGPVHDAYSPSNKIMLLPTNSLSSILLWTNMLTEFNCGTWQAGSNGNYQFRFQIVDKNAASSGYALALDYLKFTPVTTPLSSPIEEWRVAKFGSDTNNPVISGDGADPDEDGIANLFEYACAREPLTADPTPLFTVGEEAGYLTLTYQRAKAATDVVVIAEASGGLTGTWNTNLQAPVAIDDGNGLTETVQVQDSVPIGSASSRFMRLRVNRL